MALMTARPAACSLNGAILSACAPTTQQERWLIRAGSSPRRTAVTMPACVSVKRLGAHVLPWTAASFLLIVPSGLAMFTAHATEFIQSDVFVLKMLLIMAAGLNAALFHAITFRTADVWDAEEMRRLPPPPSARLAGALSLLLWIAVIACGRLLAYF